VCIIISLEDLITFFTAKYATATAKEKGLGAARRFQHFGSAGHKIRFGQPIHATTIALLPRAPPL
jgi:hypothetical protein